MKKITLSAFCLSDDELLNFLKKCPDFVLECGLELTGFNVKRLKDVNPVALSNLEKGEKITFLECQFHFTPLFGAASIF
ncbi:MAG TPA: hypothetical protein VI959_03190 [Alphaproteobacteria bacterium]|nr:hypothetical protein [Alphaproteobacteria bacterium]